MSRTRRALLASVGAGTAALAGCLGGGSGSESNDGTPVPPADGPIATVPLPDSPADREYAEMGTDGPVVTYFGNWKCPFCAEFSVGSDRVLPLEALVTEYVEPGDLRLRYRSVAYTGEGDPFLGPDAPRATRAGLAVWTGDPASYWRYHEYVMANQPPESEQWATTDRLVEFAEGAGVAELETVRERIEAGAFEDRVEATADAFQQAGAEGTPTLVVDGEPVSPFDPETARAALDSLVG